MLRLKHDIVLELCDALKARVKEFRSTPDYLDFLRQRLLKAQEELRAFQRVEIEILEEDLSRYQDDLTAEIQALGFDQAVISWQPVKRGMMGGLIFYNEDRSLKLDGSFDVLLEDAEVVMGQLVAELLEERGVANA